MKRTAILFAALILMLSACTKDVQKVSKPEDWSGVLQNDLIAGSPVILNTLIADTAAFMDAGFPDGMEGVDQKIVDEYTVLIAPKQKLIKTANESTVTGLLQVLKSLKIDPEGLTQTGFNSSDDGSKSTATIEFGQGEKTQFRVEITSVKTAQGYRLIEPLSWY